MVNLDVTVRSEDQGHPGANFSGAEKVERFNTMTTIVVLAYGLSVFLLGLVAGAAMVWIFRGCTLPPGW